MTAASGCPIASRPVGDQIAEAQPFLHVGRRDQGHLPGPGGLDLGGGVTGLLGQRERLPGRPDRVGDPSGVGRHHGELGEQPGAQRAGQVGVAEGLPAQPRDDVRRLGVRHALQTSAARATRSPRPIVSARSAASAQLERHRS